MSLSKAEMQQALDMYDSLLRLCKQLGSHDPENSVQQTYERILKAQDQFTSGTNLRAWVYLIARNEVKSSFRKLNREIMPGDDKVHAMIETKSGGQHEALELKQLFEFISQMPDVQQKVLYAAMEGTDYKSLSEEMGVSVGTTKSRINRARHNLSIAMDPRNLIFK